MNVPDATNIVQIVSFMLCALYRMKNYGIILNISCGSLIGSVEDCLIERLLPLCGPP